MIQGEAWKVHTPNDFYYKALLIKMETDTLEQRVSGRVVQTTTGGFLPPVCVSWGMAYSRNMGVWGGECYPLVWETIPIIILISQCVSHQTQNSKPAVPIVLANLFRKIWLQELIYKQTGGERHLIPLRKTGRIQQQPWSPGQIQWKGQCLMHEGSQSCYKITATVSRVWLVQF